MATVDRNHMNCKVLRINCPDWYEREDFQKYLNAPRTATWHVKDQNPGDFSDIFFVYDHDEGSDSFEIPEDIWEEVCQMAKKENIEYAIVWLTNLREV